MYKVDPKDVIPSRSDDEIKALEKKEQGLIGSSKNAGKKANILFRQFMAIGENINKTNMFEAVNLAHKMSDLANDKSAANSVCVKGCAHCCQVNVDVTVVEAIYIEKMTGHEINIKPYSIPAGSKLVPYCPFLNQESATCSIHEYRPIACRGFFTFDDPKLCVGNDQIHAVSNAWHVPATRVIMEMLLECSNGEVKDIRSYFSNVNL